MKQIKKFNEFKETQLNEGFFNNIWKKMKSLFRDLKNKFGKDAWEKYMIIRKKENTLPKGVEVYIPNLSVSEGHVSLEHPGNVINVEADYLKKRIKQSYYRRVKYGKLQSMFIWGAPGIGKTKIIEQLCDELDIKLIVFHLSQIDPTDFRGLPIILDIEVENEETGEKEIKKRSDAALPLVFPTSNGINGKGGILFLDEINLAPKMVLDAAMPLALDGKYAGFELPSKWIIITAGNREGDVPEVTPIEGALANRFRHLNFITTIDAWTKWANNKKYIDPRLVAFLNFDSSYLHRLDDDEVPIKNTAWPSPRTWAEASEAIYYDNNESFNVSNNEMFLNYSEIVGEEAAQAFLNYIKLMEIMPESEIKKIYKTGKGKLPPKRIDEVDGVLMGIAFYKNGTELTKKELENLLNYAIYMYENMDVANFEIMTKFVNAIKDAHTDENNRCYLKEKQPWRDVWDNFIDVWYDAAEKMEEGDDSVAMKKAQLINNINK